MSERVESQFVAYVQGILQEVSIEDRVKALVGYLATRDLGELLQALPSGSLRLIHAPGLNTFFTGRDFSAEDASQALRPLLERMIHQWVEQSRIQGETKLLPDLTGNQLVGGAIMPDHSYMAQEMVRTLLANIDHGQLESFLPRSEIFTADVEAAVQRFRLQLRFHREVPEPFPCAILRGDDANPIPVDWIPTNSLFIPSSPLAPPLPFNRYSYWMDPWFSVGPNPLTEIQPFAPERAVEFLEKRLMSFLAIRFSARQSDISKSPGLEFTVNTSAQGLRVHYSPAYFLNINNVFGSPTSPVTSWIQPGRYIFGVQGPTDLVPRFDQGEYDIPPRAEANLVIS